MSKPTTQPTGNPAPGISEIDKFIGCVKKTLTFHFEKECISYLISKGLSIGIVALSFTSKLPQILYMIKSKDIKGLSYLSIYLDILCFVCSTLYPIHMSYPFLTYGENLIILFENLIIFFIAWKNDIQQNADKNNMTFTFIVSSFLYICYKGFLNDNAWKMVGSASTLLSMGSRITQIINSYKEKSTGPLSTITFLLNMMGNAARIFTTMKETGDKIMVGGFVISFLLNLIVFLQIIYYNRKKIEVSDDKKNIEMTTNKEEEDKDSKKKTQ